VVRLNLGSGNHYAEGWTNVDIHSTDEVQPDLVCDVRRLPFDSVDAIYAGHVLEHLPYEDVRPAIDHWISITRPGGKVLVVGPDVDAADIMLAEGEIDAEVHSLIEHGAGRWADDVHLWRSSKGAMRALCADLYPRFIPVRPLAEAGMWPIVSGVAWQFAMMLEVPDAA
jgi:SAM-dependent methyltransferase